MTCRNSVFREPEQNVLLSISSKSAERFCVGQCARTNNRAVPTILFKPEPLWYMSTGHAEKRDLQAVRSKISSNIEYNFADMIALFHPFMGAPGIFQRINHIHHRRDGTAGEHRPDL